MQINIAQMAPAAGFLALLLAFTIGSHADQQGTDKQAPAETIYLIGQDLTGHSVVQSVPENTFTTNLSAVFSAVQGGLLPALQSHEDKVSGAAPGSLELRNIGVGVGLTGQIGLGPLFNVQLNPRLRLVFSNSKTPVYPQ